MEKNSNMPDTARTPLLSAIHAAHGEDGVDGPLDDAYDSGKFPSELWLLLRTTVPVIAGVLPQRLVRGTWAHFDE